MQALAATARARLPLPSSTRNNTMQGVQQAGLRCYASRLAPAAAVGATVGASAATAPHLRTQLGGSKRLLACHRYTNVGTRRSWRPAAVRAMVNVDVSPSVVLGVGLIGAGVSLWQIRRVKPWISKDYDVVVSCVSLLVGGILIFQGWRLDPLLLFGQLMTTGAAISFAIEALRLRSEMYESEEKAALQDVFQRKGPGGGGAGGAFQLPPPDAAQQAPWAGDAGGEQGWAAQQQWQQQPPDPFYGYQQQQDPVASASGGYGYDAAAGQQQPWDYGSSSSVGGGAAPYQASPYEAPGGGDAAGFYAAGSSGAGPSEFVFPATYEEPGAGSSSEPDGSSWGAYGAQQQQPPQQQQPGGAPPPAAGRGGSSYDMDDW